MRHLIEQERFEMEVLDRLNSGRFLRFFIFCGGTMLRLCHGLDRYSVDLDFWMSDPEQGERVFSDLQTYLSRFYSMKDATVKFYTLIFEFRSPAYPRSLKVEIRKEPRRPETEQAIAFSPHSSRQVLLQVVSLRQMMALKAAAFLDRGEMRDAYDMEFLVKKGIPPVADQEMLGEMLRRIESIPQRDYTVKLGSLLEPEKRGYYREHNFRILKAAIQDRLKGHL